MKEIGVSGGTFNPIHYWHLIGAQCAVEQFDLEKLIFIPNGNPPHKKVGVLDKMLRWEMVLAAIEGNARFEASRIEIDREGPSYTLDTLTALKAQYGDDVRLNLLIGLDNLEPIRAWYKADEIFRICRLLVAPRLTATPEQVSKLTANLPSHTQFAMVDAPSSSISSTLIRERIAQGRSIEYLVPPAVHRILVDKKHYKTVPCSTPDSSAQTLSGGQPRPGTTADTTAASPASTSE